MAAKSLIADAIESARLVRLGRRLGREHRRACGGPSRWELFLAAIFHSVRILYLWGLPVLPPCLAFSLVEMEDISAWTRWFWIVLIASGQPIGSAGSRMVRLTPFEALCMPSREGLLLWRWLRSLPWLVWIGASWSLVAAGKVLAAGGALTVPAITFMGVVFLSPGLVAACEGLYRLTEREGRRIKENSVVVAAGISVGALFILGILPLEPLAWIPGWAAWLGPPALFFWGWALASTIRGQRIAIRRAAIAGRARFAQTSRKARTRSRRIPIGPSPFIEGRRNLWRAQAYLWWKVWTWDIMRAGGLVMMGHLLQALPGALAVLAAGDRSGLALPALAAFLASRVIPISGPGSGESLRFYLLGVDIREQVLHNLRALFLFAVPVTLAVTLGTALLLGLTTTRLGVIAVILSFILLRAGCRGLPRIPETSLRPVLLGFLVLLGLLFVPSCDGPTLLVVAAVVGLLGLIGLARRILRLEEARLRALMRE